MENTIEELKRKLFLERDNSVIPQYVEYMKEAFYSMYGKRRVDFCSESTRSTYWAGDVIIHFPKIEISNSVGQKHTIFDLYIKLSLQVDSSRGITFRDQFYGTRSTFSLKELMSSYSHSHLSGMRGFNHFCKGHSDEPINKMESRLIETGTKEMEVLEMFFVQLEAYLKWESLEGVPYVSIKNIGYESLIGCSSTDHETSFRNFIKQIKAKKFKLELEYEFLGNVLLIAQLKRTEALTKAIFAAATKRGRLTSSGNFKTDLSRVLIQKKWYKTRRDYKGSIALVFKGKNLPLTILKPPFDEDGEAGNVLETHAHPSIEKYIIDNLNQKLLQYSYDHRQIIQQKGCTRSDSFQETKKTPSQTENILFRTVATSTSSLLSGTVRSF